jgi:hypothetical protein
LIDRGVIDAQEERERLARDPESGYQGIDISKEIAPPDEAEESANLARGTDSALGYDADFVESEHPRDDDGKFGGGAGSKSLGAAKSWEKGMTTWERAEVREDAERALIQAK